MPRNIHIKTMVIAMPVDAVTLTAHAGELLLNVFHAQLHELFQDINATCARYRGKSGEIRDTKQPHTWLYKQARAVKDSHDAGMVPLAFAFDMVEIHDGGQQGSANGCRDVPWQFLGGSV